MSSPPTNSAAPGLPLPTLPPLTNTYGALLISSFLALGWDTMRSSHVKGVYHMFPSLYGFIVNQTYRYYRLFPKDFTFHRVMVRVLRYYE